MNPEKPIIYRHFDLHRITRNSAKMALESILRNVDENRLFVIYVVVW
jgi:DNA-nicking Smr family endonuclease